MKLHLSGDKLPWTQGALEAATQTAKCKPA